MIKNTINRKITSELDGTRKVEVTIFLDLDQTKSSSNKPILTQSLAPPHLRQKGPVLEIDTAHIKQPGKDCHQLKLKKI